jgi:hypothetical protein
MILYSSLMLLSKLFILKSLRKVYQLIFGPKMSKKPECIQDPDLASDIIYDQLFADKPCMIGRFGAFELSVLVNYLGVLKGENKIDFITSKQVQWWWEKSLIKSLNTNAGFFPPNKKKIEQFCQLMLKDIPEVDVLGSWLAGENILKKELASAQKIHFRLLEPFWSDITWTKALSGKKVLVVHPFAETILNQYSNRAKLFKNSDTLPEFKSLSVIKAVQSLGDGDDRFTDWFEALDFLIKQIDQIDYEVCLIGCGAYGFHLAAHVKRSGKKAVHLGGALQLLFGIKGKRWEDPNYGVKEWGIPVGSYSNLMNEYWVRPGDIYKPKNAEEVEGACYW